MITEKEYLEAKRNLIESIEILRLYKLQPKEKKPSSKKTFTIDEINKNLSNIFSRNEDLKYTQLVKEVCKEFKVGINKSKLIIGEFIKLKIIKSKGIRKGYSFK